MVSSVTIVVGNGVVIFVFEGHNLYLGNPNVEGGQIPVASTDGGHEKGDSACPLIKKMCGR